MFAVENQSQLVLFTEKFEHKVEELEKKMAQIARGIDPYEAGVADSASGVDAKTDIGK